MRQAAVHQGREHGAAVGAAGGPAADGDRNARRPPGRAQRGHRHRAVEVSGRPVPDLPGLRHRAGAGVRGAAGGVAGTDRARGRGAGRGRHAASAPPRLGLPDQARAAAVGDPGGRRNSRRGAAPGGLGRGATSRRGVRSAGPGPDSGRDQPGSGWSGRCWPDREPAAPGPGPPRPRSPRPGSTTGRSWLGSGRRPAAGRVGRPGRRVGARPGRAAGGHLVPRPRTAPGAAAAAAAPRLPPRAGHHPRRGGRGRPSLSAATGCSTGP